MHVPYELARAVERVLDHTLLYAHKHIEYAGVSGAEEGVLRALRKGR